MRKKQKRLSLIMLGVLLLAPLTVSAPSQNTHASEQGKLLCKEYKAMQMDALVSMRLSRLTDRYYSSEQNKKEYFRFLREVAAVYDEYAEALLSCRKQGQCYVSSIQDICSSFSKRIDALSKLDRLETKDIMKKEVDDLLGEDEYVDYIPFQMPKVTFYLTIICRNYRYQAYLLPDSRPQSITSLPKVAGQPDRQCADLGIRP
jgi:hypothetical protein